MKDANVKQSFIELRAQGLSYGKIAEKLDVTRQTLMKWSHGFANEIANMKAVEIDALQQQFYISKTARIEFLGGLLNKLSDEIECRDLTDIPTDKLLDMMLRYSIEIGKERQDTIFTEKRETSLVDMMAENFKTVVSDEWKG